MIHVTSYSFFHFFFNDTATTEIYTLSLHDALPISTAEFMISKEWIEEKVLRPLQSQDAVVIPCEVKIHDEKGNHLTTGKVFRSEEHTSELQSQFHLVCRLLLEKKKKNKKKK